MATPLVRVVLALVVASCTAAPSAGPGDARASDALQGFDGLALGDLRYSCGEPTLSFGRDVLVGAASDEDRPDARSVALRQLIASDLGSFLPHHGWRLVAATESMVEFLAIRAGAIEAEATLRLEAGQWKSFGWGDCAPRVLGPSGLNHVEWALDPAARQPAAGDTRIKVLVSEVECSGGASLPDRLDRPVVIDSPDAVVVILFATPPGPPGVAYTCIGISPERVTLELDTPLDGRPLLDGSALPPQPAARGL